MKFVFLTNELPWFEDKTDGIWRRMIVIPFTHALKSDDEADPDLRPALQLELPGILNWALKGLDRLIKNKRFTHCPICAEAAQKHLADCSPVGEFIRDNFTFVAEYSGDQVGLVWMTNKAQIAQALKDYKSQFGENKLAIFVICGTLAQMPGVTTSRPTTVVARTNGGTVYHGVVLGEPRRAFPDG